MDENKLREIRKKKFALLEQQLKDIHPKEENRLFYHYSNENRFVLSHALFWSMTFLDIPLPFLIKRGCTFPCFSSPQARKILGISRNPHSQGLGMIHKVFVLRMNHD